MTFSLDKRPEVIRLKNDVELNVLHVENTELVRFDLCFVGGQWLQKQPLQARMAFNMLKEGTQNQSAQEIADFLDFYGATLSVSVNASFATVTLYCLRRFAPFLLPLLHDLIIAPGFAEERFERLKEHQLYSWKISHARMDTLCREKMLQMLYGAEHPLGRYTVEDDFRTLELDMVRWYYDNCIGASYCVAYLTGNVDDALLSDFQKAFGDPFGCAKGVGGQQVWNGLHADRKSFFVNYSPVSFEEQSLKIETGHHEPQASVRVGCLLPSSSHSDMPIIRLATTILGGYFGSRLMKTVREGDGNTYDIHGTIFNVPYHNAYVIQSQTPVSCAEGVVSKVYEELEKLVDAPIPSDELQMVKKYIVGTACRQYETNLRFPQVCMSLLPSCRTLDDLQQGINCIKNVDACMVQNVARQWLSKERFFDCIAI